VHLRNSGARLFADERSAQVFADVSVSQITQERNRKKAMLEGLVAKRRTSAQSAVDGKQLRRHGK